MERNIPDGCSVLTIVPVERLQKSINKTVKELAAGEIPGVYICFNRPQKAIRSSLEKQGIDTSKILFIDCITTSLGTPDNTDNTIHIQSPADLTSLRIAIDEFVEKIPGKKFLVIDALATLLIYNSEELVLKFVKSIIEKTSGSGLQTFVLTPDTKGGELINKVSLFFDEVRKE